MVSKVAFTSQVRLSGPNQNEIDTFRSFTIQSGLVSQCTNESGANEKRKMLRGVYDGAEPEMYSQKSFLLVRNLAAENVNTEIKQEETEKTTATNLQTQSALTLTEKHELAANTFANTGSNPTKHIWRANAC